MHTAPTRSVRRVCAGWVLAASLSVAATLHLTGQEPMEDMCAGEMQWMIGWCLDMVMPGDDVEVARFASSTASYSGGIESIDVPGAVATRAFGINPQGEIVGSYTTAGVTHGFLLRDGAITTIDYPDAASTEAWGINARGDIIGRYTVAERDGVLGFLVREGHFSDISIPSATGPGGKHLTTLPTKIGASGEIVGCFHDANALIDMFGYVQRGTEILSTFALPSTIGPAATMHNGITPGGGTIVGLTNPAPGRSRGYVITNNALTYLDAPGATATNAWDINPTGTVIGQHNAGGRIHGFYWNSDGFVSLDVPNSTMTVARGINPRGQIVGVYNDASGTHGFVTRP
jgi:uncharacterized membrane protein